MIRKIVIAALCLASAAFGQAVGGNGVPGGPGSSATLPTATAAGQLLNSTGAGTAYAAQSKIALDPRDFGADFNGASVADATTTNGSNVITCANSDCNFPSNIASASYIIFATAGNGSSCLDNASITFGGALQTTVTGFTNANSITVSGNSNTTGTATVCLAWFPKDSTTALNAWWTAGGCTGVYQMPAGKTLFSAPIMQNLSGCLGAVNAGLAYPGQTVRGAGLGSTFLIPAPIFTYTAITGQMFSNICAIGNLNVEDSENFAVFGLGERYTGAATNTCLFLVGQASRAINIDLVGWNARGGGANLVGAYMEGATDVWEVGGSNYFGSVEMYMNNTGQYILSSFTSGNNAGINGTCGFRVAGGGQVTLVGNGNNVCSQVDGGAIMTSTGTQFNGATGDTVAFYANGGRVYLLGNDSIGLTTSIPLSFNTTGSAVFAQGATFAGITGAASNYFFDNGGNVFNGTTTLSGLIWPQNLSVVGVTPAAANTVLGAGWGASAAASAFSPNSDERHFTFTITNGASGVAQSTATIVYTFPRAFQIAPGSCRATQVGGTQGGGTAPLTLTTSTPQTATAVTFTSATIPTISLTEVIAVDCQ